jgi:hypothetical protein
MAYDANNLNQCFVRVGSGEGGANAGFGVGMWTYRSAEALATVIADNFITDGGDQGIKVGDAILFIETASGGTWAEVDTVSAAGLVAVSALSGMT